MRSPLLGLAVPVLLIASALAVSMVPQAAAQTTTYTITGRVLSDTGAPLEGVRVSGWTYHEDATRSSTATNDDDITDADGRYELTLAAGKGNINIYYEKWRQSDYRDLLIEGDTTLDFTLKTPPPKTAIITGVVVDADGKPVPGADVQLGYGCCIMYAEPAVADAPTPSDGGSSGAGTTGTAAPEPANDTEVVAKESMTRPAMMPPYSYYDDWAATTSDENGRFRFEAYAGPRQITAWAKGYAQTTLLVEAKDGETTEVEVVLEKVPDRNAILEGRVVDSRTGLALKGASVNVRSLEWGRYAYAVTDSDGRYRIQTVPGWTEISVSYYPSYDLPMPAEGVSADMVIAPRPPDTQYYTYSVIVKLAPGDNDHDAKLESKPKPTVVLTGYVVDPDAKKGVPGATVNVWNQDTGDWGTAVTDDTGSYRILVREGHHTANAWKDGYLGGTQTFNVEGASERADITLPKGTMRNAPCYDDECGYPYPIAMREADAKYAEEGQSSVSGSAAPPPAAPMPSSAPALSGTSVDDAGTSGSAGPDTSRAATYSGTGGGLPPYDAEAAAVEDDGATGSTDGSAPGESAPVPGLGILAALGVLALAALALRRRR